MDDNKTTMSAAVCELLAKIDKVTEHAVTRCGESLQASRANEEFVGVVIHQWTKAIYTLYNGHRLRMEHLKTDIQSDPELTDEEKVTLKRKHEKFDAEGDVLKEMFWLSVRQELNSYDTNLGVRKDWTIVVTDQGEEFKNAVLSALFGGIR